MRAAIYARVSTFDQDPRTSYMNSGGMLRLAGGRAPSSWTVVSAGQRTGVLRSTRYSGMPSDDDSMCWSAGVWIGLAATCGTS